MKFWLLSQNENNGYDTFDSCVVAAPTKKEARMIHPYDTQFPGDNWGNTISQVWASSPDRVTVEFLGYAKSRTKRGVICASFNAG